jgi:hypothetical protein
VALAQYLDLLGVLWTHVPNESSAGKLWRIKMARMGVKSGVPDVLIFTPPPRLSWVGAALELKAPKDGRSRPTVTLNQTMWLETLAKMGWATKVAYGFTEALEWLDWLGYRRVGRVR